MLTYSLRAWQETQEVPRRVKEEDLMKELYFKGMAVKGMTKLPASKSRLARSRD